MGTGKTSQQDRLLKKAQKLHVAVEDLLTTDGKAVAYEALKDFSAPLDHVTVSFQKGQRIREWHQIDGLLRGRCSDIVSVEQELRRRVREMQAHRRLSVLALASAIASALSAAAAWFAALEHRG